MTDAKEFINCFVNIEEQRICILMLHLFISCSINYPLCAELILKQFTFNHSDYVYIIFSIWHVNHISYSCMSCILGWRPFITFIYWINLEILKYISLDLYHQTQLRVIPWTHTWHTACMRKFIAHKLSTTGTLIYCSCTNIQVYRTNCYLKYERTSRSCPLSLPD